jgi:hypothetical protein
MRIARRAPLVSGLAMALGIATAAAQEHCVRCTGPEATYRCVPDDAALPPPSAKLLCITTLALDGGHATCAIQGTRAGACTGPERLVSAAALAPSGNLPYPAAPSRPAPSGEPQTVEELTRQMARATGEQMEKAGDAVGSAARKTWGCIASLFKSC